MTERLPQEIADDLTHSAARLIVAFREIGEIARHALDGFTVLSQKAPNDDLDPPLPTTERD